MSNVEVPVNSQMFQEQLPRLGPDSWGPFIRVETGVRGLFWNPESF